MCLHSNLNFLSQVVCFLLTLQTMTLLIPANLLVKKILTSRTKLIAARITTAFSDNGISTFALMVSSGIR